MDGESRAALFVNTRSRHGADEYERVVHLLGEARVPLGVSRAVYEPDELPRLVAEAVDRGYQRVLVGGGDGTISSVAASFVGGRAVLGILPVGTGNLVARALGIGELEQAVAAVAAGHEATIDVAVAGDRYFLNTLSIGLAATFRQAAPRSLKHRLGQAAYAIAAARAYARSRSFFARLTVDGADISVVCQDVVVSNGRYIGPDMLAGPSAELDNHQMVVFTLGGRNRIQLMIQAIEVWFGRHAYNPKFHYRITDALTITADPPQKYLLDGEPGGVTPVAVRLIPDAIRVFAPPGFDQTPGRSEP
jgi:diacylglycerol kinase (ATP)